MFASNTGLKILSESDKWHSDGTFHTKAKYFAQLYTIHAYFPPSKYDPEKPDRVWVKRMIPCVWSFMKRRRTKDYENFLREIEDTGIRFQNTSLEEATCHTLTNHHKSLLYHRLLYNLSMSLLL